MSEKSFGHLKTDLVHRVAIYVPGTRERSIRDGHAEQMQQSWTDASVDTFGALFGGATAMNVIGCCRDPTGVMVRAPVNLVFAYCTLSQLELGTPTVLTLARAICKHMCQDCVAVEVDHALFFFTAE